ncbi:endolytic transglycosylase MltG, partial [Bradyrhizobium sp. NBAIM08]|uniref:endolytic transglycosylase MltG n=1 Tax=Bradyrhizobium sp. NBAIM08 TaxID=2793815 RepID=UPI001CD66313|nr:endolytic transglycosylase MltG [Bradyrhizobium sp. NBAIM08]
MIIPEGFRLAQIADRVGRLPGMSKQKFLELAASGQVRSEFQPNDSKSLEGFLFPSTYSISASDDELTMLQRMVNLFDIQAHTAGLDAAGRQIGHTPYDTLIIASLIEAEAKTEGDRWKISQVIENRGAIDMALQIDASVLYGLGNTKTSLSK